MPRVDLERLGEHISELAGEPDLMVAVILFGSVARGKRRRGATSTSS